MTPLLIPTKLTEAMIRDIIAKNDGKGFAVKNIPNQEYHDGPGLSSTDIKALINGTVSSWLHGKANRKPPTPALRLGIAIHTMVLEKDQFWERYCLEEHAPKAPSRSTKEGKAAWNEWVEYSGWADDLTSDQWKAKWLKWKHPEFKKEIIDYEDVLICEGIARSVESHPMVSQMFAEGESELTLYWIDKETGILCKCRPDRTNQTFPCIPDLKSTMDAVLDSFEQDITAHDYHVSAYWYLWGAKEVFGFDFQNFVYIPCEKVEPFNVTFYTADEGSLSVGEGLCRAGLAIYQKYQFMIQKMLPEQQWTGYSLEPKAAGIRPYAFNKLSQVIHSHDLQGMGLEKFVGVV